jgi:hypothetical protein
MAKTDKFLARIEADEARLRDIRAYVVERSDDAALLEKIDAETADLQRIRDYATNSGEATATPKVKRTRKKKGLPATDTASL